MVYMIVIIIDMALSDISGIMYTVERAVNRLDFDLLVGVLWYFILESIVAGIIIGFITSFINYAREYVQLRWEVNNTQVSGQQWRFKDDINGFAGILFLCGFLSFITMGLSGLLGIDYYLITKFRYSHVSIGLLTRFK
jgi:MFS superfamily sulfate permease-like transporter